jgi:hypothetical protein
MGAFPITKGDLRPLPKPVFHVVVDWALKWAGLASLGQLWPSRLPAFPGVASRVF